MWATSKWNNDVVWISSLRSMIRWKWMSGFLYQTSNAGERARQRRDRKRARVWETEHCRKRRIASAIKQTVRENIYDRYVRLISKEIKMLLMMLFTRFAFFSINLPTTFQPTTSCKFPILFYLSFDYTTVLKQCKHWFEYQHLLFHWDIWWSMF